jgi:PAS domain S-box-containing protein
MNGKGIYSGRAGFQKMSGISQDGIIVMDFEGKIVSASPNIGALLNRDPSEIIGNTLSAFCGDGRINGNLTQEIEKQGGMLFTEMSLKRENGESIDIGFSSFLLRNEAGNACWLIGVLKDIQDRKELEAQLLQAQKMEAVGTLAGGIAHDFNNILMGILGYTSLLLQEKKPGQSDYEKLRSIESQALSGADLTRKLLGFAQGGKYEIKPVDLNEILIKSAEMFGRTKKDVRIRRRFEKHLWPVEADRVQIEQVFLNLFINAWQAMPGGGELYLETANVVLDSKEAEVITAKPGRNIKISVTDTGIGMDEQTRRRLFEPFFTTKEKGRGTGLGLASSYGIIRGHGGIITVRSEKGHGSTFEIHLPATDKPVWREPQRSYKTYLGKETLMIVDDEEIILDVSGQMLESLGYRVITARGGAEAVRVFQARKDEISAVILDMIMPEMGGRKTFEALKEIEPGVRVLLSSGYTMNGEAKLLLASGCRGFIQKPFDLNQLSGKVREIMDTAQGGNSVNP